MATNQPLTNTSTLTPEQERTAQVANVADITASKIGSQGPMKVANVEKVQEAQKNIISEDPTVRSKQLGLIEKLEGRVSGEQPSIAEMQFKAQMDKVLKAQAAQAATTRGAQGSLLAQREGQIKAGEMMQEGALQSSMMRAQEQKEAEQSLSNMLGAVRGTDVTKAVEESRLGTQTDLANLNVRADQASQQAQIRAQAYQTEYTTEADRLKANANLEMQAKVANQNKDLQTAIQTAQNKVSLLNNKMSADTQLQVTDMNLASKNAQMAAEMMQRQYEFSSSQDFQMAMAKPEIMLKAQQMANENAIALERLKQGWSDIGLRGDSLQAQIDQFEASRPTVPEKIVGTLISGAQVISGFGEAKLR